MPNWCDCKLTIQGPNRQAVLDKLKGDKPYAENGAEHAVYFDVDKIIPMPEGLGGDSRWVYDNWGCRTVYPEDQFHNVLDDADVIKFCTPWNPPLLAVRSLSSMFPENTFILEDHGNDLPSGATVFRGGRHSHHHRATNINSDTGNTATLFEIFCAVLQRTRDVEQAKKEVEKVKASRFDGTIAEVLAIDKDRDSHDPTLDQVAEALMYPHRYDVSMIPADEQEIADLLADSDRLREYGAPQVIDKVVSAEDRTLVVER